MVSSERQSQVAGRRIFLRPGGVGITMNNYSSDETEFYDFEILQPDLKMLRKRFDTIQKSELTRCSDNFISIAFQKISTLAIEIQFG